MERSEEEKQLFGDRISGLIMQAGYKRSGRGDLSGTTVPNCSAFAKAYVKHTNEKLSYKSVEKWCRGESFCETKRIPALCELLETDRDFLMGGVESSSVLDNTSPELQALMDMATPRSQSIIEQIAEAANQGRLTEDDLTLLKSIADRFQK
ncbi:hypothetical protein [Neptuniibacter sp.]|uniref:hypothetical protein n=1 Tax=Neptuniibacter sp. TaxID=1962643 RepID=UPI00262A9B53|nr:hypothetical protein [Neptuniibacter sp.]MCP4596165.1 hypothetical protein [Neptuniibacter sp.]